MTHRSEDNLPQLRKITDRLTGVAVKYPELSDNKTYRHLVASQFGSFTPENAFKPARIHPEANRFNWEETDRIVTFAETHQQRVHGHALVWHRELPEWIIRFKGEASDWQQLLRHHIQQTVSRYRNLISSWDVVNEAFTNEGELRENIWLRHIGPDYIRLAFEAAAEADPQALLFYNDYDLEYRSLKTGKVLHFLNGLKDDGVPVHGIGLQMHLSLLYPDGSVLEETLRAFIEHRYLIRFSELDVSYAAPGIVFPDNLASEKKQEEILLSVLSHFKNIPAELQHGITFWGIGDGDSWLRHEVYANDKPLLFDENYNPKLVFYSVAAALATVNQI